MRVLVREIKEMSTTELISTLCFNMFDEATKRMETTQMHICKELERRNIIESANDLFDKLSK